MIRLTFALHPRKDMKLESFHAYLKKERAALIRENAATLKLQRYTQCLTVSDPLNEEFRKSRDLAPPHEAVEEFWWESLQDILRVREESEGREALDALTQNEADFVDSSGSFLYFAYEAPQINPVPENLVAKENNPLVKLYYVLNRKKNQTLKEAQEYWRITHAPKVRRVGQAIRTLRYMQVHRLDHELNALFSKEHNVPENTYFGHVEMWFDRVELLASFETPEGMAAVEALVKDEMKFIDFSGSAIWLSKENVLIDQF